MAITIPSLIFGFLLIPAFLGLVVSIGTTRDAHRWHGLMGIGFSLIYSVFISFNYFAQIAFLIKGVEVPIWLAMDNTDSLFMVIEMLGYFFMGLATLVLVPFFSNSALGKSIKVLFLANAILGIGGLAGYALGWPMSILLAGLVLWNIIMPVAAILIYLECKSSQH